MNRNKCQSCGLVNAASDENCRRCGAPLAGEATVVETDDVPTEPEPEKKRGILKRLLWIAGATLFLLFSFYLSLRVTSEDLGYDQRQIVARSLLILEQKGFGSEAGMLKHLATYRSTDNWWNKYVGHHDAYAATNFPFEVLTLYPEFFGDSTDDTERAVILLHESYHLRGAGEPAALEKVWRNKARLGWNEETYGQSRVWRNTRELTMNLVPQLFQCGPDGNADCVP
jgi:hypothetical protein